MSGITAWQRLEPSTRSEDLEPGLQARIADPLWLLARQWQFGEFQGEDAGSPVSARLQGQSLSLGYWRAGALPADGNGSAGAQPLPAAPLEAIVECEPMVSGPSAARLSAEAGLHFCRLLRQHGCEVVRNEFRRAFPLGLPSGASDEAATRYLEIMRTRALDGRALRAAIPKVVAPPPGVTVAAAVRPAVVKALTAYVAWYDARILEPAAGTATWTPERMEYSFAVSAGSGTSEVVLAAREYMGGQLDWHAFDVRPGARLAPATHAAKPAAFDVTLLPTTVTFHGAPRSRWWEIEDASVDIGAMEAGPADIARLVLAEFALLHSDDWFMLPLELPAGSLARVMTLTVTDAFGVATVVKPASQVDGKTSAWRGFTLAGDPALAGTGAPWLLVAPALGRGVQGDPIEVLALLRDEMANLAWGVERTVEGIDGRPIDRFEAWLAKRHASGTAAQSTTDVARYRLAPEVPEHWYPLVPVKTGERSIGLRRGRVLVDTTATAPAPIGRLLEPGRKLVLFEEEVPSEGVSVTRAWQMARGADGATILWVGRRKQPGRTERAPGLSFDRID